ncbi:recombinase family protein [Rhizobium sp. BK661]|uniref:recombinase family protein n=1 Tax=Rhizobium sp. BK661 TaxID=2586991 RepID=UPI00216829E9|nr:recombinase family protein [Rhizobium sp. BK661]MCS3738242.1 DNA invertase Pin-like site-specific DNA recombinase [Rhizobium sp. BK661]
MTSAIIGYARTSTIDQTAGLEAQLRDLEAMGCQRIFKEQLSSVDTKRPELERAIDYVREGDTLVVTKLDRLARSMTHLTEITGKLKAKGVELKVLALNLDTSTPTGKLMLNLLGSIAEFERELMLERQREGIAKAKAEGKYHGRVPTARRKTDDILRLKAEGKTVDAITKELGISRSSIFRVLREA